MPREKMTDEQFDYWFNVTLEKTVEDEKTFLLSLYYLERAMGEGDPEKQPWVDREACKIFSEIICLYYDCLQSITDELKRWEFDRDFERTLDEVAERERDVLIALKHL